jgi:hypothetical protein
MCFLGAFANLKLSTRRHGSMWEQSLICLVELKALIATRTPVLQRIMPKMHNEGLSEANRKTLNSKAAL